MSSCAAQSTAATKDLIPAPFNARTRVHEYGGGSYVLDKERILFSNFADQRIYAVSCTGPAEPLPITAEGPYRYADAVIDAGRGRLLCVREDHSDPDGEPVNTLVGVDLDGPAGHGQVLVSGADFYAAPRLSPGWPAARLAVLEPPRHALGRHRAVGRGSRPQRRPARA